VPSTAAKERMSPIVWVINNDGYGTQRHIALQLFNGFLDEAIKKLIKCYIFIFYSVFIHYFSFAKKWKHYIIDGKFNNIQQWDYAKLPELLRYGTSYECRTNGELETALKAAVADREALVLIEVIVPRDDCSANLRRMGEALGKMRDKEKR
jgi:TPP-dependent 2-oxoacid decarboxylase